MTQEVLHRPDISVHFARVCYLRAADLGVDQGGMLQALRLSPQLLGDSRTRLSPVQLGALLRLVWRELDDELMGFGAMPHRFGTFALMARQMVESATLGDALRYATRFNNLTSHAVRWGLDVGREAELTIALADPEVDSDHMLEEFYLMMWHRFSNWLIGERIPLQRTRFGFVQPAHANEHRLMFPGRISYGHGQSSIFFDAQWLARPVIRSREELARYLRRLPDEWFIKQTFEGSISERVAAAFSDMESFCTLEELAGRWHMSSRTLHRQLGQEGTSFRGIREQVRRERAIHLLLEGGLQVREIARQLDMTEPAFSRAFKQWTGMSPLAYRRARA